MHIELRQARVRMEGFADCTKCNRIVQAPPGQKQNAAKSLSARTQPV